MKIIEILLDPELFAAYWFETVKGDKKETLANFVLGYYAELSMFNRQRIINGDKKISGLTNQLLTYAFESYIEKRPLLKRKKVADKVKCIAEDLTELKKWLKGVTGQEAADELAVMAHWIWLVKRNLYELPVVYHIMPILTSPKQGGGKSTAVKMLVNALEEQSIELRVKQAVDERAYTLFSDYLIGFFDEMAGADKVDSNDLKATLSADSLSYRPMRTNIQQKIKNNCSFIGTSNNDLYETIKDTTGIRRFFPITAMQLLNHEIINSVDYVKLWKGVDENKPRGYLEEAKALIDEKQAAIQMKDELRIFLEDNMLIPAEGETKKVNGKDLFLQYQKFMEESGVRYKLSRQTFYKKLLTNGIRGRQERDKNKSITWFFEVNAGAYLENFYGQPN